jgi:hypothetical protein
MINDPANRELLVRLLASNLRLNNPADVEETYLAVMQNYERVPHPTIDGMKRLQKLLTQQNPKLAEVRVETLVDGSVMNKLESSGFIQGLYKKN